MRIIHYPLAFVSLFSLASFAGSTQLLLLSGFVPPSTKVQLKSPTSVRAPASSAPGAAFEVATLSAASNMASAFEISITSKGGESYSLSVDGSRDHRSSKRARGKSRLSRRQGASSASNGRVRIIPGSESREYRIMATRASAARNNPQNADTLLLLVTSI